MSRLKASGLAYGIRKAKAWLELEESVLAPMNKTSKLVTMDEKKA